MIGGLGRRCRRRRSQVLARPEHAPTAEVPSTGHLSVLAGWIEGVSSMAGELESAAGGKADAGGPGLVFVGASEDDYGCRIFVC